VGLEARRLRLARRFVVDHFHPSVAVKEKAKAIMLDELAKCDTLMSVKVVIYSR